MNPLLRRKVAPVMERGAPGHPDCRHGSRARIRLHLPVGTGLLPGGQRQRGQDLRTLARRLWLRGGEVGKHSVVYETHDFAGKLCLQSYAGRVRRTIEVFGNMHAKALELHATVHFARQSGRRVRTIEETIEAVRNLKGNRFSEEEIRKAIEYLDSNGLS